MKKNNFVQLIVFCITAILTICNIGFSQENTNGSFTQPDGSEAVQRALLSDTYCDGNLSVSIQFYNRSIYHVDDDIFV